MYKRTQFYYRNCLLINFKGTEAEVQKCNHERLEILIIILFFKTFLPP